MPESLELQSEKQGQVVGKVSNMLSSVLILPNRLQQGLHMLPLFNLAETVGLRDNNVSQIKHFCVFIQVGKRLLNALGSVLKKLRPIFKVPL